MRSKGQISLNFNSQISFTDFLYQSFCVSSQIIDVKQNKIFFYFVDYVMLQCWDLGLLGVNTLSVGICDGAQSTAHSNLLFVNRML